MDIDRKLQEMESRWKSVETQIETKTGGSAKATSLGHMPGVASSPLRSSLEPLARQAVHPKAMMSALICTPEEVNQLAAYVLNSPHVTRNPQYAHMAARMVLQPDLENAMVNAMAGFMPSPEGTKELVPVIRMFGGALLVSRLLAVACMADRGVRTDRFGDYFRKTIQTLGREMLTSSAQLTPDSALKVAVDCGLPQVVEHPSVQRQSRSLAAGMTVSILAHEMGHHALGHTLAPCVNLDVSRNQEREADSFASSIISTSPFGEYMVEGTILWELVWVWCERAAGHAAATTHPLAHERLLDFIRANAQTASELGLTPEQIAEFLP